MTTQGLSLAARTVWEARAHARCTTYRTAAEGRDEGHRLEEGIGMGRKGKRRTKEGPNSQLDSS
eukprot:7605112-Pyramimonas_sp.AAC.1